MGFPPTSFANRNRRAGGIEARAAGAAFEKLIEASQVDHLGPVVSLAQIKNFAKRTRNGAGDFVIIEERSPFDFCGSIWGVGRMIAFDAKRCGDSPSLRVNSEDIVKRHQIESLERLSAAGAITGILVECCRCQDFRWLPGTRLRSLKPIQWDDERWFVIGPNTGKVQFRTLVEAYGVTI